MSEVTIRINTDGAALADETGGYELSRILNVIGDTAQDLGVSGVNGMALFDVNGNRVGRVEVSL